MCFDGLKQKVRSSSVDFLNNSLRYRDLIRIEDAVKLNGEDFQHLMTDEVGF